MDALADFLRADAARTFRYGECDCLLRLADWGLVLTGIDALARWRGRYVTATGAARILKREGGMLAFVDMAFGPLGFARTTEPGRGDIAIVTIVEGMTGAIMTGRSIASLPKFRGAVRLASVPVVACWTRVE